MVNKEGTKVNNSLLCLQCKNVNLEFGKILQPLWKKNTFFSENAFLIVPTWFIKLEPINLVFEAMRSTFCSKILKCTSVNNKGNKF